MTTQVIVRGNTVTFQATFFDINNAPTNPSSAALYLAYQSPTGEVVVGPIAMTQGGNTWTAIWDSTGIPAGRVYWSIRTSATSKTADDGFFDLTANLANPAS